MWAMSSLWPKVAALCARLNHNTSLSHCQECIGPENAWVLLFPPFSLPRLPLHPGYYYALSCISLPVYASLFNAPRIILCSCPGSLAPASLPILLGSGFCTKAPSLHFPLFFSPVHSPFSTFLVFSLQWDGSLRWGYVLLRDSLFDYYCSICCIFQDRF